MALLATEPRIAFDRAYPFENRCLAYLVKFCLLTGRPGPSAHLDSVQLTDYYDDRFGSVPWWAPAPADGKPLMPSSSSCFRALWQEFSASARTADERFTHYGEKVPDWLPAAIRDEVPCRVIGLVRDPRDVFLSARDFVRARGAVGFGMQPGTAEIEDARNTAHKLLCYAENARADDSRSDSIMIRYEDLVRKPLDCANRLSSFLGLNLDAGAAPTAHIDSHRTSATVEDSIGRWKREPLSNTIHVCLETHLRRHMIDHGYELTGKGTVPAEVVPDQRMTCSPEGSLCVTNDRTFLTVTGGDFSVELPPNPLQAKSDDEIWICLQGDTGDHCSVYWRDAREPFAEDRSVHVPFRPGRHWQILRVKVGEHPLWRGTVEQIRVDLLNGIVLPGRGGEIRWVRYVQ
jgi:Sulfotransferase family